MDSEESERLWQKVLRESKHVLAPEKVQSMSAMLTQLQALGVQPPEVVMTARLEREVAAVIKEGKALWRGQKPRDPATSFLAAAGRRRGIVERPVETALVEGRLLVKDGPAREPLVRGMRVVERVVLTRQQVSDRRDFDALFEWEAAQRGLGRTVMFYDDLERESIVFEAREAI
jgi:hypothetical protein